MGRLSLEVKVDPSVLRWLRESAGYTLQDVARRIKCSEDVAIRMEEGTKPPTLRQLKEMAAAYHRPLALFLLNEPLVEPSMPEDFRRLPDSRRRFSRKVMRAVQKARNDMETIVELAGNIGMDLGPLVKGCVLNDDPEEIAGGIRKDLGLDADTQTDLESPYAFFRFLRNALEDRNIFVFSHPMPVEEARGMAFADGRPVAIIISSSDVIQARLFTLIHEVGHILLGISSIDIPDPEYCGNNEVERWCDRFAASFLLPGELLHGVVPQNDLTIDDIGRLGRRFHLSKTMVLITLLKHGLISTGKKDTIMEELRSRELPVPDGGGGVGRTKDRIVDAEKGRRLVSMVADNLEGRHITYSAALSYLSIKSQHFDATISQASR